MLEKSLQICNTIPDWKPYKLNKGDLDTDYQIRVDLKAPDPVESDRLSTLGERLWANGQGSIDLKTNLMEYKGKTEEESDKIMAARIVDQLTMSEEAGAIYKMLFAEEAGLQGYLEELQAKGAQIAGQGGTTPTQRKRLQGEVQTERGREEGELSLESKGARIPPKRYEQGGY